MTNRKMLSTIGRNVKAELSRAGRSQTDAAALLGMSQAQMSERCRGEVAFRIDEVLTLAAWLDVPIDRFLLDVEIAEVLLPHLDSNQKPAGYLPSVAEFYLANPKSRVNLAPRPAERVGTTRAA